MTLVQVHDGGVDPHRSERPDPADPEERVLRQADLAVADVQARGDPPVHPIVVGPLRVQEEERDAADVDAPNLQANPAPPQVDHHREGLAVGAGDERGGEPVRVGFDPVLVLPARGVHALVEVALPVQDADADHGQAPVRRLLQDVAREDAETPGVGRERAMDPVLGAEEHDRPRVRAGRVGVGQLGLEGLLHGLRPRDERAVLGGFDERVVGRVHEEPDGVLAPHRPAVGIDVPEDVRAAGHPGPSVVVGQAREDGEAGGEPGGEVVGRPEQVLLARLDHSRASSPNAGKTRTLPPTGLHFRP